MKTLYLDCFAGIAGDMFLGAMLDLGLDKNSFLRTMESIVLFPPNKDCTSHSHTHNHEDSSTSKLQISITHASRGGVTGTKVDIASLEEHPHRGLSDVLAIIESSPLSRTVKERSSAAFRILAEAEAKVHGTTPEEVHFHEVGAIDSIADIIGAFILVEMSGAERVLSSSLNIGHGTVNCAHGILPVPAPATAELLIGLPVHVEGEPMERVTPTGALLVKTLASGFGPMPDGRLLASGKGVGERSCDLPNMLRVMMLDTEETRSPIFKRDKAIILETNIDDMNPQYYTPVMNSLLAEGALDVWLTPAIMKKGRPSITLKCLCVPGTESNIAERLIRDTTTLGVRMYAVDRFKTETEIVERETPWGIVRFKTARLEDEFLRANPEFEDVRRLSEEHGIPLTEMREKLMGEFLL